MATMNPQPPVPPPSNEKSGGLNVPAWGSFLYQNFLLPAFSPSEWLNSNTPSGVNNGSTMDYFNSHEQQQQQQQSSHQQQQQQQSSQSYQPYPSQPSHPSLQPILPARSATNPFPYSQAGPSTYYQQPNYYASAIPTSLLQSSQQPSSSSVDVIDNLVTSPTSSRPTPHPSPKHFAPVSRGTKRRAGSLDSTESFDHEVEHEHEHEHDIAEGVERDGMIWGMKVEDYRALSARERKRVRNRISARTFRAKRKEHLSSLELDLEAKDSQIKAANDEASRLRKQVAELSARLAKYERV